MSLGVFDTVVFFSIIHLVFIWFSAPCPPWGAFSKITDLLDNWGYFSGREEAFVPLFFVDRAVIIILQARKSPGLFKSFLLSFWDMGPGMFRPGPFFWYVDML